MSKESRIMIFEPQGPQGPKIGIEINEVGDIIALDTAMGELSQDQRKAIEGIKEAAQMAGLQVVKP